MKTDDRSKFRAKKEDIVALLDALQESFQKYRDKVTPKEVAARMGQKLHKQIPLPLVNDTHSLLDFVTRKSNKSGEGYYLIPNPSLLAERRSQFCKGESGSSYPLS